MFKALGTSPGVKMGSEPELWAFEPNPGNADVKLLIDYTTTNPTHAKKNACEAVLMVSFQGYLKGFFSFFRPF